MAFHLTAQNELDSVYVASVDSIINSKQEMISSLKYKQFRDRLNHSDVNMIFDKETLVTIYVESISCEETTFHIKNDSLILVKYTLSDPDIRSSLPPSKTINIYFKNDKQIYSSISTMFGSPKTCNSFSVENKNFIKEYYYYKSLDIKGDD